MQDLSEQFIDLGIVVPVILQRVGKTQTERFGILPVVFQNPDQLGKRYEFLFKNEFPDRIQAVGLP